MKFEFHFIVCITICLYYHLPVLPLTCMTFVPIIIKKYRFFFVLHHGIQLSEWNRIRCVRKNPVMKIEDINQKTNAKGSSVVVFEVVIFNVYHYLNIS